MPYKLVMHHEKCPASKPVAVVKKDDEKIMGCHENVEAADKQMAALHIAMEKE